MANSDPPPVTAAGQRAYVAAAAVLWVLVGLRYAILLPQLPGRAAELDFSFYYTSAVGLSKGLDPYSADLAPLGRSLGVHVGEGFRSNYTPVFLILFEPLARQSLYSAYWIWFTFSVSALLAALGILLRTAKLRPAIVSLLIAGFLLSPPVTDHFKTAQCQFVILLLLVLMLRCIQAGRNDLAGLALAAATLFKAFPIVMIGYLVRRRKWRALGWTMGALLVGISLTFPVLGPHKWIEFLGNNSGSPYANTPLNMGLPAFISRVYWHLRTFHSSSLVRGTIIAVVQLTLLVITFLATPPSEDPNGHGFSLWLTTTLLISPIVWSHYLTLLIIPIFQLVSAASASRASGRAIAAMGFACALVFVSLPSPFSPGTPKHGIEELLSEFGVVALCLAYLSTFLLVREYPRDESSTSARASMASFRWLPS